MITYRRNIVIYFSKSQMYYNIIVFIWIIGLYAGGLIKPGRRVACVHTALGMSLQAIHTTCTMTGEKLFEHDWALCTMLKNRVFTVNGVTL